MSSSEPGVRLSPSAAPPPPAGRSTSRLRRWWLAATSPFWVLPAAWCVGAVVVGLLIPELDRSLVGRLPFVFQSGPDGARSVLSTIAGAMISVTGLVFSITIVVLQLASSQFSPRVLRTFLDDRTTQNTLGVFAASFLYALTVLRAVQTAASDTSGYPDVPQIAVAFAYLLVLGAVGMFLAFIHHITTAISVGSVVGRAADGSRALISAGRRDGADLPMVTPTVPRLRRQVVVTAPRSGYLDVVDRRRLYRLACDHDVRIEVLHPLGTFVVEDSPLAMVHTDDPVDAQDWGRHLLSGVELSRERTMRQDVSFGLRRLVDIAERALSPGVNDPTTAIQVLDEIHDLLRRLSTGDDPLPVTCDDRQVARVVTDQWSFADYLDLAIDEIAFYGRESLQVPRRLDTMFAELVASAGEDRRPVVQAKWDQVLAARPS